MALNPRKKRLAASSNSRSLLGALNFVSVVQEKKDDAHFKMHCRIENGFVTATDGISSAGHKIDEEFSAQPHTLKLIDALNKCGQTLSMTILDEENLSIVSEIAGKKFSVVIPCTPEVIPVIVPDPPCAVINDTLKKCFAIVAPLIKDEDETVSKTSVLLRKGSVVSTDHQIMLESWHGFDLPSRYVLPKGFITAIIKTPKTLESFGCSINSVTVHFTDGSWLKTQVFDNKYPDIDKALNVQSNVWPVPEGLFEGFDVVASFSDNKIIYFRKNLICSHKDQYQGASFEVDGLPENCAFKAEHLKMIRGKVTSIDFTTHAHAALLFGDKLRGAIIKMVN